MNFLRSLADIAKQYLRNLNPSFENPYPGEKVLEVALSTSLANLPTLEHFEWKADLPMLRAREMTPRVKLFGKAGDNAIEDLANRVDTFLPSNSLLQTCILLGAVGVHLSCDSRSFVQPGVLKNHADTATLLEWGNAGFEALRAMNLGYLLRITANERLLLLNEPLRHVSYFAPSEPARTVRAPTQAFVDEVNATLAAQERRFVPLDPMADIAYGTYAAFGNPRHKFGTPLLLPAGTALGASLVTEYADEIERMIRALNPADRLVGGWIQFRIEFYGWEVPQGGFYMEALDRLGIRPIPTPQ